MTRKERKRKKKEQMKNKRLIKKYYWLRPLSAWTGKPLEDYDYTFIEWGWCPGWDKAFGQMFMDELGAAIKESGQKDYQIVQIKEKFASLRLYDNGSSQKVHDIIRKYEVISQHVCMDCGREAPTIDDGWMSVMCFDCFKKYYRRREQFYDDEPITDEQIKELYGKYVRDEMDENGKHHIPNSYKYTMFKNGDGIVTVEEDISDTVNKIRKRISKFGRY